MCRGEGFQCVPRELSPACPEGTIRARYSCNEREVLTEDGPYCCAPEASVPPERR
jgi:hypothetical protein